MSDRARTIGVVSDTHGYFDPALPELLSGVEAILHAGDIVGGSVLDALERIAPVIAIVGNNDGPPLSSELPEWRTVELDGERILLVHDLGKPERVRPPAAKLLARERPSIVVSGHSHAGRVDVRDGVLFFNPGSAGKKRFRLLRSAGFLVFHSRVVEARLVSLEGRVGEVVASAQLPRRR
ncbi:MAG TPA: metallophosphoesterase [Myxococcaceae bacterium]|jgi:putative phosphoesterase|nr:metallophosphoesterase [Myxococcaceae bacterium]